MRNPQSTRFRHGGYPARWSRARRTAWHAGVSQRRQPMSANLTVYSMAMAAEAPSRAREVERAYQAAVAEAASGCHSDRLLLRLAYAMGWVRRRGILGVSVERANTGGVTVTQWAG